MQHLQRVMTPPLLVIFALAHFGAVMPSLADAYTWTVGDSGHCATRLASGSILLSGGQEGFDEVLDSSQLYTPSTDALSNLDAMNGPRGYHSSSLLTDGRVLLAGGSDGYDSLNSIEFFDPTTGAFSYFGATLLQPREDPLATTLPDGRILISGGWNAQGEVSTQEIIDPTLGTVELASGLALLVFPTVMTDKPDYIPGELVAVTGSGWQPFETVVLLFDEVPLQYPPEMIEVLADENGQIEDATFEVQEHHVGTAFVLHATGLTSAWSAQSEFTDGSILMITALGATAPSGAADEKVSTNQLFTLSATIKNQGIGGANRPAFENILAALMVPSGFIKNSADPDTFTLTTGVSTTVSWSITGPASPQIVDMILMVVGTPSTGSCGGGGMDCQDQEQVQISAYSAAYLSVLSASISPILRKEGEQSTLTFQVKNDADAPGAKALSVTPTLSTSATGTASASCGSGGSAVTLTADSGTTFSWTCTVSGDGILTFTATATGTEENTGATLEVNSDPLQLTVDSTGPVLDLPDPMTVLATSSSGAEVTFEASAEDALSGPETVSCTPSSGSTFARCDTTVNCSATDDAGSISSGSFVITVVDEWYVDSDADGYGDLNSSIQRCNGAPAGYVADSSDCNDAASSIYAGAAETCNQLDDDCDNEVDEGVLLTFYRDFDGDGYGNSAVTTNACDAPLGFVADFSDCNDALASIHPAASESCNQLDDDCDNEVDEGVLSTFYLDADGDAYGIEQTTQQACTALEGYAVVAGDCNDAAADIHPNATEECDLVDNDCDHEIEDDECPDAEDVAPEVDPGVVTVPSSALSFLYSGEHPLQQEVNPALLESQRTGLVRGVVRDRELVALEKVKVSVQDHPELGWTFSGDAGEFDLVVNAGTRLTLAFEKEGYYPVQREISARWQRSYSLPDVVLIQPDPMAMLLELNSFTLVYAVGSSFTDTHGTRTPVLLMKAGTTAQAEFEEGTPVLLSEEITVRASEYTLGDDGLLAMPAELPATSGYTHAIEMRVEEAETLGATSVSFSAPVIFYQENFRNVTCGTDVPVGYYDPRLSTWVGTDNGRVITMTGVDGSGRALVNVNGANNCAANSEAVVDAFGIDDEERYILASLYQSVAPISLWQVPLSHFSTYDCNYPLYAPDGARAPEDGPVADVPECEPCEQARSILEIENQVLGESIALPGTGFSLNYRSNRTPGRRSLYTLTIPLLGESAHEELLGVELELDIAGQHHQWTYDISELEPGATHTFTWNGRDGYGREVRGTQMVVGKTGYIYPGSYEETEGFSQVGSGSEVSSDEDAEYVTLWLNWERVLGTWDARDQGFGGWSLDMHHVYDPNGQILWMGDGRRVSAGGTSRSVRTVAGGGDNYNENGFADEALVYEPMGIAPDGQGGIYVADYGSHVVWYVTPDGILERLAGTVGIAGYAGDGGPANECLLSAPWDVAVADDGSVYITDHGNSAIRRVGNDSSRTITTVAGRVGSGATYVPIGQPATSLYLTYPQGIDLSRDGDLYIADTGTHRILRVDPAGRAWLLAGTGTEGFAGDGFNAKLAQLDTPHDVAVGPDGSVAIADAYNRRIRQVGVDGIITTIAGNAGAVASLATGQATDVTLGMPTALAWSS